MLFFLRPERRTGDIPPSDKRQAKVDIIARIMLVCVNIFVVLAASTAEQSLPKIMSDSAGLMGKLPILALQISALLLSIDILMHDVAPKLAALLSSTRGPAFCRLADSMAALAVPLIAKQRHWIYFWTGWCFLMPAFTATTQGLHKPAATWLYITMAACACALALRHVLAVRRGASACVP